MVLFKNNRKTRFPQLSHGEKPQKDEDISVSSENSKLYYLMSRYYDPETGRYFAPKDANQIGFEQDGLNLYTYCHNRPLTVDELEIKPVSATAVDVQTQPTLSEIAAVAAGAMGDIFSFASIAEDFVTSIKLISDLGRFGIIIDAGEKIFSAISVFLETGDIIKMLSNFGLDLLKDFAINIVSYIIMSYPILFLACIIALGLAFIIKELCFNE